MNKDKKVYILLVISFILFVSVFIVTFILKYSNLKGNINIKRKYYEIVYKSNNENVIINNDIINIKYSKDKELFFDIYNVGNIDANVNSVSIDNINTDLNKDNLNIILNSNTNDFIKGGNVKRVYVKAEYDGEITEKNYLNFNIKYVFNE